MAFARLQKCDPFFEDTERDARLDPYFQAKQGYRWPQPEPEPEYLNEVELGTMYVKHHTKEMGGRKNDDGKLPWSLLPFDSLTGVAKVLQYGAIKYAPRNWELGINYSRVFDACLRHLTDWYLKADKGKGQGKDADTGYSDLWHAGCCILFLITYEMRGSGKDDRP